MKPKRIRLADIIPGKTYMIRGRPEFIPVTVECDFTHGWLRGWVKLDLDPLWHPHAWEHPHIWVKPLNPTQRPHAIPISRSGDDFYCYTSFDGITLFEYEGGWAEQKIAEARAMIYELQRRIDWLSTVEGDKTESRIFAKSVIWSPESAQYQRGI